MVKTAYSAGSPAAPRRWDSVFWTDGLLEMYGPPLRCKRKMTVTVWSAQMYPAFFLSYCSWHLMECAAFASYLLTQSRTTLTSTRFSRGVHCAPPSEVL